MDKCLNGLKMKDLKFERTCAIEFLPESIPRYIPYRMSIHIDLKSLLRSLIEISIKCPKCQYLIHFSPNLICDDVVICPLCRSILKFNVKTGKVEIIS